MTGWEEWWFRARHERRLHYVLPMLPLIAWAAQLQESGEGQPVVARIRSFSPSENIRSPAWEGFRVYAETDGLRGSIEVNLSDISGCKIADDIEAVKVGLRLYLKPRACN